MNPMRIFFPHVCPHCKAPAADAFCDECAGAVAAWGRSVRTPGLTYYAAFLYEGPVRAGLLHLKKYAHTPAKTFFARRMAEMLRARGVPPPDAVVCVPAGRDRRRRLGFNHAAVLGKAVAAELGLPFLPRALRKVRETQAQHLLPHDRRQRNVENAFAAEEKRVRGRRLLLVDDIVTTGATAKACIDALTAAGAAGVTVVCAATPRTALGQAGPNAPKRKQRS